MEPRKRIGNAHPRPMPRDGNVLPPNRFRHDPTCGTLGGMFGKRLTVALLLLSALTGCHDLNTQARLSLAEGEQAFNRKQYDAAIQHLTRFIAQADDDSATHRALYVRGMARALSGRRNAAYTDLERAARTSSGKDITWRANAALGILYFEDEQWAMAARALEATAHSMPAVAPKDAFLYRLGLCYERTHRWSKALIAYRSIVSSFGRGAYAAAASRRLTLEAQRFAVQCGVFARRENADRLVHELREENLNAYVRGERRNGTSYHVVLVGRYDTYADATSALARVRGYIPKAVLWP